MTITGRLTKDATISTLEDGRKVVNFSVAFNDNYKPKGGERVRTTTYYACSYWRGEGVARLLTKGSVIQLDGRIEARVYVTKEGEPKASINCHVNDLKILSRPKEVEVIVRPSGADGTYYA